MIQLRIDAADRAGCWRFSEGRWVCGKSTITPFAHPSIETFEVRHKGHRLLVVRENPDASDASGALREFSSDLTHAQLLAGLVDWPLNVVVISLPCSGDDPVTIHTGRQANAPLFLMRGEHGLLGSWDVAQLYDAMPFRLDLGRAAFVLCHLGLPYSRRTIYPDLFQLTERATACWSCQTGSLEVHYPPAALRAMPRRLQEGADIPAAFEQLLGSAIARSANGSAIASELSGGLDSACATLAAAASLGPDRVRTFGLLLPGSQKLTQQARREALASLAAVADTPVDAEGLGPFCRGALADIDPVVPWGEYYREAFLALGQIIADSGCRIVVRGIGGDEISELIDGEVPPADPDEDLDQSEPLPDYLTAEARQAYADLKDLDEAPPGYAPSTFYQGTAASAPVYLRRGIWPVYPYGTTEVVDFCRSLPTSWRADRTLQRSMLRAAGLPDEVVRPKVPETFLPLRDLMFEGAAADYVRAIFRAPLLAELGVVDTQRLNTAFEAAVRNPQAEERTHLLEAATMETMLRTWRRQSIPMGP